MSNVSYLCRSFNHDYNVWSPLVKIIKKQLKDRLFDGLDMEIYTCTLPIIRSTPGMASPIGVDVLVGEHDYYTGEGKNEYKFYSLDE